MRTVRPNLELQISVLSFRTLINTDDADQKIKNQRYLR